jgi:sugar lactone lactonase YvrE
MSITHLRVRPLLTTLGASLLMALCTACGGGSGNPAAVAPPVSTTPPPVVTIPSPVVTPALSVLAGNVLEAGNVDGSGADARFDGPGALTIDTAGNLYVGASCLIRKVTAAGVVSNYAGAYCPPNSGGSFATPFNLASAADGRLFMTIYGLNIVEVSPAGVAQKYAALEAAGGGGRGAAIAYGNGIAVDAAGNVIVTNHVGARKIAPSGSYTMLDGVASMDAGFNTYVPERRGVAVDAAGTVYLASIFNEILRIDAAGKTTVLAGTHGLGGTSDGTGAEARFANVIALAVDAQGNLYAADSVPTYNALIRKITPAGVVTTIAGKPGVTVLQTGALPGGLAPLGGIALDGKGNLYATSGNAIVKIVLP